MSIEIKAPIEAVVHWVLKEQRNGLWVALYDFKNVVTNYGATALASAPFGAYNPPLYLVIDTASTTLAGAVGINASSVITNADPTLAGDTQLVLSAGLSSQEIVTFSSKSGSGPYTFTLSTNTVNAHNSNDPVVRGVTKTDTMASVVSEGQYDPTFNANKRLPVTSSYSPGQGQSTGQFFISGVVATNLFFAHVGLADQINIPGIGTNLHNYAPLGYSHTNTSNVEIDVTYTITAI